MSRNFNLEDFDRDLNPDTYPLNHTVTYHASMMRNAKTATSFICPQCGTMTSSKFDAYYGFNTNPIPPEKWKATLGEARIQLLDDNAASEPGSIIVVSHCQTCEKSSIWLETKASELLVYPHTSRIAPAPDTDMPDDAKAVYLEAASIVELSPRAAVGLLRLAAQIIVDSVIDGKGSFNDKIGKLAGKLGSDDLITQGLDVMRVYGNDNVHPKQTTEIKLTDNAEDAKILFLILNYIVSTLITPSKGIARLHDAMSDNQKASIEHRDAKNSVK